VEATPVGDLPVGDLPTGISPRPRTGLPPAGAIAKPRLMSAVLCRAARNTSYSYSKLAKLHRTEL
jgi:hypothetical protein